MSSHPGSDLNAAIELACYLRDTGFYPEQVQDFYPDARHAFDVHVLYGLDPRTMQRFFVARSPEEKAMQRALMQYKNPQNQPLVLKALRLAGARRPDWLRQSNALCRRSAICGTTAVPRVRATIRHTRARRFATPTSGSKTAKSRRTAVNGEDTNCIRNALGAVKFDSPRAVFSITATAAAPCFLRLPASGA